MSIWGGHSFTVKPLKPLFLATPSLKPEVWAEGGEAWLVVWPEVTFAL